MCYTLQLKPMKKLAKGIAPCNFRPFLTTYNPFAYYYLEITRQVEILGMCCIANWYNEGRSRKKLQKQCKDQMSFFVNVWWSCQREEGGADSHDIMTTTRFKTGINRVSHITPFFELSLVLLTTHAIGLYEVTKKFQRYRQ